MIYFVSPSYDPYYNLALEEHLFATLPQGEDCLFLWQNDHAIVVGKNQNAHQEVNRPYVEANGISVARRLSGGGAVYHDLGNLNFTIITQQEQFAQFHFQRFVQPVLQTLAFFGLEGAFTGRNDLTVDGMKFCGNAQYHKGGRLLHHGCIMVSTDLSQVVKALNVNPKKLQSKAVKSVASSVTTLNTQAAAPIPMEDFKETLRRFVFADSPMEEYVLTPQDETAIKELRDNKYATWDWIYGTAGHYQVTREEKFHWGLVAVHYTAKESHIATMAIYGDFFGSRPIEALTAKLVGHPLDESLRQTLTTLSVGEYLQGCTPEELYELMMG